jgi:hypothetical protein
MNVERLISFFALEGNSVEFLTGCTRAAPQADRMNVERLFFSLETDAWIQAGLHTRAAGRGCMNVGASYLFCVGGPTAWYSGWLNTRSAAIQTA